MACKSRLIFFFWLGDTKHVFSKEKLYIFGIQRLRKNAPQARNAAAKLPINSVNKSAQLNATEGGICHGIKVFHPQTAV